MLHNLFNAVGKLGQQWLKKPRCSEVPEVPGSGSTGVTGSTGVRSFLLPLLPVFAKIGPDVRSNSNLASGLKSRPRNCPYALVARRSGVRVIEGREFLTTKMQAVTQVNLDVAS